MFPLRGKWTGEDHFHNRIYCMVLSYLKGLVIIKCGFFYLALWNYYVFSICGDYICRSILILNNWYQITFLGQIREESFCSFYRNFLGKENRAVHFRFISEALRAGFGKKKMGIWIPLRKILNFKKQINQNGVQEVKLWEF